MKCGSSDISGLAVGFAGGRVMNIRGNSGMYTCKACGYVGTPIEFSTEAQRKRYAKSKK
jgi:hypothetical protein